MHFISCDYRYNKDEHSIEPHICRSCVFQYTRQSPDNNVSLLFQVHIGYYYLQEEEDRSEYIFHRSGKMKTRYPEPSFVSYYGRVHEKIF